MESYFDILNDDCQYLIMDRLTTAEQINLLNVSSRLDANLHYYWSYYCHKICINDDIAKSNVAGRLEFWSILAPNVKELILQNLDEKLLLEMEQFTFPNVRSLKYMSLYTRVKQQNFNNKHVIEFSKIFPSLENLLLNCLVARSIINKFKLTKLTWVLYNWRSGPSKTVLSPKMLQYLMKKA